MLPEPEYRGSGGTSAFDDSVGTAAYNFTVVATHGDCFPQPQGSVGRVIATLRGFDLVEEGAVDQRLTERSASTRTSRTSRVTAVSQNIGGAASKPGRSVSSVLLIRSPPRSSLRRRPGEHLRL